MIRSFFTRQFAQFVFVGVLAALLNWLSRLLFSQWMPFAWAVAAAYTVGMAAAFALNSFFVFPLSDRPRYAQARDFILINCAFFPLVWVVSFELDIWLISAGMTEHSEESAHAIALATPMLATFLLYKFMAFKERPLHNKPVEDSD